MREPATRSVRRTGAGRLGIRRRRDCTGGPAYSMPSRESGGEVVHEPFCVTSCLDVPPCLLDPPIGPDHERGADHPLVLPPVVLLRAPYPVRDGDGMIGVRQQGKRQAVLVAEPCEHLHRVRADPGDRVSGGGKRLVGVPEVTRLGGAARGERLGVEVEDEALPGEVAERHLGALVVEQRESRGGVPGVDGHVPPRVARERSASAVSALTRSWPQAASISTPLVSRSVTAAPPRPTSATKASIRAAGGRCCGAIGVGFIGMTFTWARSSRAIEPSARACSGVSLTPSISVHSSVTR